MRTIGCLFVLAFVLFTPLSACALNRGVEPVPIFTDAGPAADASEPCTPEPDASLPTPEAMWPRSHPSGTLLVDHEQQFWMVGERGMRLPVRSSDDIGAVGLLPRDAIPMTHEEERCLTPEASYWTAPNFNWWPVYGPDESDHGPFVVDWEAGFRYPISLEALKSYGYYVSQIDNYDDPSIAWSDLGVGDPIGLREGSIVHTEYGFMYVVHGRSFYLSPRDLVADAGFHPENAVWMSDARLRELAPPSFEMTHDTFDLCPADD